VDNFVDNDSEGEEVGMARTVAELTELWDRIVGEISAGEPQHRAFLVMTKPLGLIESADGPASLLVAAPNTFAKIVAQTNAPAPKAEAK
jgi:chromosomal replication initiator protein